MWTVYILLCSDNSYYIGSTNNLEKRLSAHKAGKGGAYTRSHKPLKILYTEEYPDKSSALRRELQLKKWTRLKKEALVQGDTRLLKKEIIASEVVKWFRE